MRHFKLLVASIFSIAMVGCSNAPPVRMLPPVSGVPLASFMAFKVEPGVIEVPSGEMIAANSWVIMVPRFIDGPDPASNDPKDDWVILPLALESQALCEKEASMLTKRVDVEIRNSIVSFDGSTNGTAFESGTVARCVRSDGSSKFVANSTEL